MPPDRHEEDGREPAPAGGPAPARAPALVVVGASHRNAAVAVREALAFAREDLPVALGRLRREADLEEVMILSTCNRVEVYASGGAAEAETIASVLRALAAGRGPLVPILYQLTGEAAVHHAFRVAAGLDSMVLGEPQVLGQLKEAYAVAERAGTLGPVLGALRQRSSTAAKRVRTDTGIGRHAVSVSHVALELARKIFGSLEGRRVLLVGAGKMSRLAANRLVREGGCATVLGRTFARTEELAASLGGRAAPLEDLRDELARADIVITSTGAPGLVVHRPDVEAARAARGGRPLFLIDIALPRDVDPAVRSLSGVFLYDLDDLRAVAEANLRERQRDAAAAEGVVAEEVAAFLGWHQSRGAVPLLVALREKAEEIRRAEVGKARQRMGTLTCEQERALEAATTAIVNKLLHAPTVRLKEMARDGPSDQQVSLARRVLGLV
ncbi:MAG TPA: glutamyl-tRNA reductase [Vicinamibacteria bacterium]|nr:glutamyl-tRNA reductase [Vicinamibacteria bacterium]